MYTFQLTGLQQIDELDMLSACDNMTWFATERQFGPPTFSISWLFRLSSHYSRYKKVTDFIHNFATELIKKRQLEMSQKVTH